VTNAIAIGFTRHSKDMPSPADMMHVYGVLEAIMNRLGASPNWFSSDDGIGRGGYKKFGGAFHKRVLENKTAGFRSVGLAASPAGSDAPGYDNFVTADFLFAPEAGTTKLELVAHEPYLRCGTATCDEIVAELAQLWPWDYGFGLERDAATAPGVYLSGAGCNLHSPEDERRTDLWYQSSHDFYKGVELPRRLFMVRDIFPYNMVGPEHLAHRLSDGRSLREFIEADADSELRPLADNLWLWKVNADRTEVMREKLRGTGIIIAE
jgi:hypothetical protein